MPTPIQIQATKLEIPYSLSQLDNKKNEIAALVESLGLTFEGEQNLYNQLIALGIEEIKLGEQYDSIDVTKGAGVAPVSIKLTESPQVGLSVDTSEGTAIVAVQEQASLSVTIEPARQIDVINEQPLIVTVTNQNVVSPSGGGGGSEASLKVGDDFNEGLTDELKAVTDTSGTESKLRLSTSKTEIGDSAIVRSSTNPTMRLIADNADNPTTGEDMGTLRFTRNFEDPLALDLARAIYADFSERVVADGGTVEGSEECVALELELIVSGEYLINMVDIRPEYTGTLGSTKADLVFYLNDGTGAPIERFRINTEGDIEVKDPSKGIILRSENNTAYRIVVGNTGTLAAIPPSSFAPSITTLPTISGTLNVGETLTATAGTTSGEPTPTTSFQWQRSDNGTTGWADISGATGTTYLLGLNDEDKYIRVQQTEENILGTATANSASTAQIGASLFDIDYKAVLDRAVALGYAIPSAAQQTLQDTLVRDLKTAGVWSKLDALYIMANDGSREFGSLNWASPSNFALSEVSSPTFTSNEGFMGNGLSSTLDTGINMGIDTTQFNQSTLNGSFGGWSYNIKDGGGAALMGDLLNVNNLRGGTADYIFGSRPGDSNLITGLYHMNEDGTNAIQYQNGSQIVSLPLDTLQTTNNTMHLLSEGGLDAFSVDTISIAFIGGDLSAEASDLYNAFNTYMSAI